MKKISSPAQYMLLLFFSLSLLVSSCGTKKSLGATVDPRDPYAGSWIEASTNGIVPTAGQEDQIVVAKASGDVGITLTGFINDVITANASGSGYTATNVNINSGLSTTFTDKTTGAVYIRNLVITQSGTQLTLTYTAYAASSTYTGTLPVIEVFKKK